MKYIKKLLVNASIFSSLFLIGVSVAVESQSEETSKLVTLKLHDKKVVMSDFTIVYAGYGHEHASSEPEEAFVATVGLSKFLLSDSSSASDEITFYYGASLTDSQPILWRHYWIRLISVSDNQQEVTLEIKQK